MAKTIATILGVVFILVGICGFFAPNLLGTHLSTTHNLVHLISGAVSLYFGLAGTLSAARLFCIIFGIVYALLGVAGLALGEGPDRMFEAWRRSACTSARRTTASTSCSASSSSSAAS